MRLISHFLIAATFCLLGLGSAARAGDHIQDSLGLFSDQAKLAANRQIDQVYKNHHWTIAVETRNAPTIPAVVKERGETDKYLTQWTTERYKENKLEGIYLVIFKNPSKFRFHIDTDQQKKMGVTPTEIKSWSNNLGENLRVEDFDAALLSTIGGMSAKLSKTSAPAAGTAQPVATPVEKGAFNKPIPAGQNAPAHAPEAEGPSILMWVLIAVGGFIIFRIIRGVMSSMSSANANGPGGMPNQYGPGNGANMGGPNMGGPGYGQGGYGAPSRGGGLMSGMLGGLFGGMAGSWMYDKMSGGHQSHPDSGQGNYTSHDASSADSARHDSYNSPSDNSLESDSTTYGGDWGNDSGGDSGGGGDYGGGGDFGGGGGDGGGDW